MGKFQSMKEWGKFLILLIKDFLPSSKSDVKPQERKTCQTHNVYIVVHEWGGYEMSREKKIHHISNFTCGLKYQLMRFSGYQGSKSLYLVVTMSDSYLHKSVGFIKDHCDEFIITSNNGKDFAGYAAFYKKIKDEDNSYVLLTNSSVNESISEFLDDYIDYMERNPDVGILGISYNSRCYQSLIKNNFTPHLQSFFLLTTIDVLNQIVLFNGNRFPGDKINNKRLLIREGEIMISQIALALGYKLAVVQENGVYKFTNNQRTWLLHDGDGRIGSCSPNKIWPIVTSNQKENNDHRRKTKE